MRLILGLVPVLEAVHTAFTFAANPPIARSPFQKFRVKLREWFVFCSVQVK